MFFAFCPFICLCVRVANKNKYIILHAAKTRARRCTNLIQIQLKKWQNNVRAQGVHHCGWIWEGWTGATVAPILFSSCGRSVTTIKRQEKGDAGTGRPFVVLTAPVSLPSNSKSYCYSSSFSPWNNSLIYAI